MSKLVQHPAALAAAAALWLMAGGAGAQTEPADTARAKSSSVKLRTSAEQVTQALAVVQQLDDVPGMRQLLRQAKGVLIVPAYGRAALGVGAQGGAGMLLLRRADGGWSGPAFYNLGALSAGLQAGVDVGAVAMVLNNDRALAEFRKKNNFSLSAEAGLTVLNWSRMAQGSAGNGDVIAWSAGKGLFGELVAVSLNDIRYNQTMTEAYYGRSLSLDDIAANAAVNVQAAPLRQALARLSSTAR
jgi:lipid-binding SYLF domain-containing protein